MEDTLGDDGKAVRDLQIFMGVLILVLMEDTLGALAI